MIQMSDELFKMIINQLPVCKPDCVSTLNDVMDRTCRTCTRYEICKKMLSEGLM